jgi:hypothetical protein
MGAKDVSFITLTSILDADPGSGGVPKQVVIEK